MTAEELQTTLIGLAASAIVGLVGKWFGLKRTEETRSAVTWALEQGVAYAAQKLKHTDSGEAKAREALKVAESLAPRAMARLDTTQKVVLVDSTYAKMKASLPHASTYSLSGAELGGGTPLPPPSKVPKPS